MSATPTEQQAHAKDHPADNCAGDDHLQDEQGPPKPGGQIGAEPHVIEIGEKAHAAQIATKCAADCTNARRAAIVLMKAVLRLSW